MPDPVKPDIRQRIITATITLRVGSSKPERMVEVAHRRRLELKAWLDRHWRDIENDVPSMFDEMSFEVTESVEGEGDEP